MYHLKHAEQEFQYTTDIERSEPEGCVDTHFLLLQKAHWEKKGILVVTTSVSLPPGIINALLIIITPYEGRDILRIPRSQKKEMRELGPKLDFV